MSAYRDELEAARARADALEAELASARGRALVRAEGTELSTLSGRPSTAFEREIDGRVSDSGLVEMIRQVREHLGVFGQVSTLPSSVTWAATKSEEENPWVLVTIEPGDGATTIRIEYRHREVVPFRSHLARLPLYAAPLTLLTALLCATLGPTWSLWLIAAPPLLILALLIWTRDEDRDAHLAERESFHQLAAALVATAADNRAPPS